MPRRYAHDDSPVIPPLQEQPLLDKTGLQAVLLDISQKRLALKQELVNMISSYSPMPDIMTTQEVDEILSAQEDE